MNNFLINRIQAHKKGKPVGVYSVCSSNRFVLEAAMLQAKKDGSFILMESTSNQVNQFGGYTGFTPRTFIRHVKEIADSIHFPFHRVILGGDHLGPYPWRKEKACHAMEKASTLVRDCVEEGFAKLHLDASMNCRDDFGFGPTLPPHVIAERTADLCLVAEATYQKHKNKKEAPLYVIGTDVPIPGGSNISKERQGVSTIQGVKETIKLTREAFFKKRLQAAWERTIAIVIQPGIDYYNTTVIGYSSEKVKKLAQYIAGQEKLVYEAHSTDFQQKEDLERMVRDHFAVLKVGPWLTFAFREAVFALADMEGEWLPRYRNIPNSQIRNKLEQVMRQNPVYWKDFYKGRRQKVSFDCKYSFSDRCRYYWPAPVIQRALSQLISHFTRYPIPLTLLSQYLPIQYNLVRAGVLSNNPVDLIHAKILEVLSRYSEVCGFRSYSGKTR